MINASYKQDFPKERRRGRPPKRWADAIRQQCGLLLLTLERRAMRIQSLLVTHEARGRQVLSTKEEEEAEDMKKSAGLLRRRKA